MSEERDLTEAEIVAVRKAQVGRYGQCDVTKPYSDSIAFAQAVIAAQREKDVCWRVPEPVGINGLTEAETSATASVMGIVGARRTVVFCKTQPDACPECVKAGRCAMDDASTQIAGPDGAVQVDRNGNPVRRTRTAGVAAPDRLA